MREELIENISNSFSHNRKRIDEVNRTNMVGKVKAQSPDRYNKRLHYHSGECAVNLSEFLSKDIIVIMVKVAEYDCIISYKGLLAEIARQVAKSSTHFANFDIVRDAVNKAIDKDNDIKVDCSCPDFKYRFAYWATKYGYKYGKPETRPAKVRNPGDDIGAMCKHLTSVLANKRWLRKAATDINEFMRANIDEVREVLGVTPEEFVINEPRFGSQKWGNKISNNNAEELEPAENVQESTIRFNSRRNRFEW